MCKFPENFNLGYACINTRLQKKKDNFFKNT